MDKQVNKPAGILKKPKKAASALKIPKANGSYEELIADPDIEAIYNPLGPDRPHKPCAKNMSSWFFA